MATITVTGTFVDVSDNPLNGKLVFTPVTSGPSSAGNIIAEPITAPVINGALSKVLLTTDSYNYVNGQVSYRVYEKLGATRRVYYIVLPSTLGASVDIATLSAFSIPPDVIIDPDAGTSEDPEVAQLQARIDDLETTVLALSGTVSSMSGQISGFTADVAAINATLGSSPEGAEATVAARLDAMTATEAADKVDTDATAAAIDARLVTAEAGIGNARLFSATSYPPAGYTAQDGDVWVDTTP